jgi:hypothetical protein
MFVFVGNHIFLFDDYEKKIKNVFFFHCMRLERISEDKKQTLNKRKKKDKFQFFFLNKLNTEKK